MRVAVTASTGRLADLEQQLRAAGHDAVRAPLVAVRPLQRAATRATASALVDLRWRLFPSRTAVEAWTALGLGFAADVRIGAVGPATADGLRVAGARVSVVGEPATALGLARGVLAHPSAPQRGEAVAIVQGDGARPDLAAALAAAGVVPQPIVVYARHALGWRLQGPVDAIVVASPSAVAALPEHVGAGSWLVAIGPTTAAAARRRGWRVRQAASPTTAAVVAALHEVTALLPAAAAVAEERAR